MGINNIRKVWYFWVFASSVTCNFLLFSFISEAIFTGNGLFILDFNAYGEMLPEFVLLLLAVIGTFYFILEWWKGNLKIELRGEKI